jgi:hypothetical protein
MQGTGTRVTWLFPLLALVALSFPASAVAGAGDDAHFLVQSVQLPNNGTVLSNKVVCPAGERATGGGVRWHSFTKTLSIRGGGPLSSAATVLDNGGIPTMWENRAMNLGTSPSSTMINYAICSGETDNAVLRMGRFAIAQDANGFPTGRSTATCSTGERVIGGGVVPEAGSQAFVMASGPVDETGQVSSTTSGDIARSWTAAVLGTQGDVWRVYAICSPTSTATIQTASVIVSAGQGPGSGASATTGVRCPEGQRALSGGVIDNAPYAWLIASAPGGPTSYASSGTPGIATGWRGYVWSQVGNNVEFKVAAICEAPTANAPLPPVDPGEPAPPATPNEPDVVSNSFKIGRFYRDKEKGRGAIVLNVSAPGTVTLTSPKLKPQVNVATEPGDIGLSVKAAGGPPREKLLRKGKLKAKVKLAFFPDGGSPSEQKEKLKLIHE